MRQIMRLAFRLAVGAVAGGLGLAAVNILLGTAAETIATIPVSLATWAWVWKEQPCG